MASWYSLRPAAVGYFVSMHAWQSACFGSETHRAIASIGRYRRLSAPIASAISRSISGVTWGPSMNLGANSSRMVDISIP